MSEGLTCQRCQRKTSRLVRHDREYWRHGWLRRESEWLCVACANKERWQR